MSQIKRLMEHRESQREVATQIALDAKLLKECEVHHEVYSAGEWDYTSGYKLGNFKITNGAFPGVFEQDERTEMAAAVKKVIEEAPEECWVCAKQRDE
jgi:hypothetical protein